MLRIFLAIAFMISLTACKHNDDSSGSCTNPIEITGTPFTSYIVRAKPGNDPNLIATEYIEAYGDKINVYTTSTTIFAAEMSSDVLGVIQCDSRVESISYDGVVGIN